MLHCTCVVKQAEFEVESLQERAEALCERVERLAYYNGATLTKEALDQFETALQALEAVSL